MPQVKVVSSHRWSYVKVHVQVDLHDKTLFGAEASGLKSEGGLLAEWSLNTGSTVQDYKTRMTKVQYIKDTLDLFYFFSL